MSLIEHGPDYGPGHRESARLESEGSWRLVAERLETERVVAVEQLRGAVEALREHQRAFDEIDSAMHELDDAEALDAIVGIVNRTRGQ